MSHLIQSEEDLSISTKRSYKRCGELFEKWKGEKACSEDLVSNFVHCYLKGSKNVEKNYGPCDIDAHRASSTRTMFSHMNR